MKGSAPSDFLIDTTVLSALLNPLHAAHNMIRSEVQALPSESRKIVSVIAIGELILGRNLASVRAARLEVGKIDQIIRRAEAHELLYVTQATGYSYGHIKAEVAKLYMPKAISAKRKLSLGNPEAWKDELAGRTLQVQENDLWQCAQAVERDLVFLTADKRIQRVVDACGGELKVHIC